jgi:Ca-activated chloride channel family protein
VEKSTVHRPQSTVDPRLWTKMSASLWNLTASRISPPKLKNIMKKKLSVLILAVIVSLGFLVAQERTITGIVTAASDGSGMPGVNVMLKGTAKATATDAQGKYKINVPEKGGTLVFSFIGYKSTEVKLSINNVVNVTLSEDQQALSEVVVTGYALRGKTSGVRTKSKMADSHAMGAGAYTQPLMSGGYYAEEKPEQWNTEAYNSINENIFHDALRNPLSTFSIDVDAASYSNMRRFINNGQQPPKDAVRIEEMVNYFDYDYQQPKGEDPFNIYTEISAAPWNAKHKLVHIGLQGKKIPTDNLPPSNLVFLIDVSGSMSDPNKLPLLVASFKLLVEQLREQDRVAIVVYAGAAGMVLPSTSGSDKKTIIGALERLEAGGSTAGGAGINLAYAIAKENFRKEGNNRVILATDGDFNVGESSDAAMERLIEDKRKDGIFLTVLGYGMGNYKDSKMEVLADKGNGNYAYIDNILEAQKVLVNEFGGTLFTIAKDVKLQIEFNPSKVKAYRLIGYENRILKSEDFNNDKKDAGELGSGHTVTAMYEIIPDGVESEFYKIDELKYQKTKVERSATNSDELMTVKFRYKKPNEDASKLIVHTLLDKETDKTSENFRWSASVAAFGMLLRESEYIKGFTYDDVLTLAQGSKGDDKEGYRIEFINMVKSMGLVAKR